MECKKKEKLLSAYTLCMPGLITLSAHKSVTKDEAEEENVAKGKIIHY